MTIFNGPQYVDVSTIREEFSKYKLDNGLTLKLKIPLLGLKEELDERDPTKHTVAGNAITNFLSYVETPPNFDTSDLQISDYNSTPKKINKLRIIQKKEVRNIYETDKAFIILGVHLDEVFTTDKKSSKGDPILDLSYGIATTFVAKPSYNDQTNSDKKLQHPS